MCVCVCVFVCVCACTFRLLYLGALLLQMCFSESGGILYMYLCSTMLFIDRRTLCTFVGLSVMFRCADCPSCLSCSGALIVRRVCYVQVRT